MSKTIVCAFVLAACATGGQSGGDGTGDPLDAAVTRQDANALTSPADAPVIRLDGGVLPLDAFVPPPIDAASSVFCTADNQCTNSGECCVDLGGSMGFCGPGTVVFGECVPQ